MVYKGTIIEESLSDKNILKALKVTRTRIEKVNESHKTPWLKVWTLHSIEVPDEKAEEIAHALSNKIDTSHGTSWYIDYRNKEIHYIIFPKKVFKVNRRNQNEYNFVKEYGVRLGIPDYQLTFSFDEIKE